MNITSFASRFATARRSVQGAIPRVLAATILAAGIGARVQAAPITWIGGNANWDAVITNWNPNDEPDPDDEAIFNTPNTVNMTLATNTIVGLTLSAGISLLTNGNELTVDGIVQLVNPNTLLTIGGVTSSLQADSATINSGGTIRLTGGALTIVEETGFGTLTVNSSGTLTGNGTINLRDVGLAANTTLMLLSGGSLTATSNSPGDLFGAVAATLTINVLDPNARVDLDNVSATVGISRNDTLKINGASHGATDPYSGTMNLAEGSTFDTSVAWQTDSLATINVNTAGSFGVGAGAAATIQGAALTFGGGTINLDDVDTLRLSAPFTSTGGTIVNAGHIIFNANSTIGAGTDFQMNGAIASLTVNAGVLATINDADFNPDGASTTTNVITIGSGGQLRLNLGLGADESLGGVINLTGGRLNVTTADDTWQIEGNVNVNADASFNSVIDGEEVTLTNNTITVGASARLHITAPSDWATNGNVVLSADSLFTTLGATVFSSPGTFTGTGRLAINGAGIFGGATTINMPGGTVNLDGVDGFGNTITVNANTIINAGTMEDFGNSNVAGTDTIVLNNFANLTVNLTDPAAAWTLTANGLLTINAAGGGFAGSGIQGSDFTIRGITNISGNSIWNARTDLFGTVNVAAAGSFNLRGGTLADLNRLEGGTIAGAGAVRALTNTGLAGFGTIGAEVAFAGNTTLQADDGILNVSGAITDVGTIGTAGTAGILNVTNPWNTNVADNVTLNGGEIRGAAIANGGAGGIKGNGTLAARVLNNTQLDAENNGTLLIQTAANDNDWDGAGAGQIRAINGNVEIRDNALFGFTGTVFANPGREVFVNGFALDFNPGSVLQLRGGTYRSLLSTPFGGTMTAGPGGESRLNVAGAFTFENASTTTLTNDLRLTNSLTEVQVGADFGGSGALINSGGATLRFSDGVVNTDFNAFVLNQGVMQLGTPGTDAQVQGKDFQQAAAGTLQIDLGGLALNAFDRLGLSGAASLAGGLQLSLIGGFVPSSGDTFIILAAPGGVAGTFSAVGQPAAMPAGLGFSVVYSPFGVQLKVVSACEAWLESFGLTTPAQKAKNADPEFDGLNNLGEFALNGNPVSGAATGKVVVKVAPVAAVNVLTLTLPVRTGTVADPGDPAGGELGLLNVADALKYKIQASDELAAWTLAVTEVVGADAAAIQAGLPGLETGWGYRTFRSPGPVAGDPGEFMRIVISQ